MTASLDKACFKYVNLAWLRNWLSIPDLGLLLYPPKPLNPIFVNTFSCFCGSSIWARIHQHHNQHRIEQLWNIGHNTKGVFLQESCAYSMVRLSTKGADFAYTKKSKYSFVTTGHPTNPSQTVSKSFPGPLLMFWAARGVEGTPRAVPEAQVPPATCRVRNVLD